MELHYKRYGDSGEFVVIVHGLFGMLDNWHNMAKKLSTDFQVVSIDVRNHGGSPHHENMSYADICEDIAELMETLHIESAHFIGHSMGGKAVMKLADLYPELINKLCVVDIAPKRYNPGHNEIFEAMFDLPVSELESRSVAENMLSKKIADKGVRLFILKNLDRLKDGGYGWKLGLHQIYKNYNDIIGPVTLSWPFSNDSLFIRGAKSGYISDQDENDIVALFPNAEFATIPDAGHWVHAENPEAFFDVVHDFLL